MNRTSDWPLPESAERVLLPQPPMQDMALNPLTSGCYPLAFGYYPQADGHHMARPDPQDYLVIYCVEGSATLEYFMATPEVDSQRIQVQRGDLLLLPPGAAHRYQADSQQPWSLYWMHLDGHQLPSLFQLLDPNNRRCLKLGLHEHLISDFRALLSLVASGYHSANLLHATSLCRSILTYAVMLAGRVHKSPGNLDIEALHHMMQQHLDQRLTVAQLAAAAGESSQWQFIRRYRAATGQTPMQAFLHRKIARACYLLEVSNAPVAEIARQFGFDDPYYFSRLFKKITGTSPAHYRQQGGKPSS
ncbi:MAG: AraC family transcriptional regulator [Alcanivoracaceae bacterium]|nr:AraC family transcriptional regulator [Alcanivoracaceae bacterium]